MRFLAVAVAAVALAGCGSEPAPVPAPAVVNVETAAMHPVKDALPAPDFTAKYDYGIVKRNGIVRVGSTVEDAFSVFAQPPNAYDQSELPPSVDQAFEARGWQARNEGFGVILARGRVAAALYQLDKVNEDRLNEILASHRTHFGAETESLAETKQVRYWFWHAPDEGGAKDLLMICATELQPGKVSVAVGYGTLPLMSALGMTPDAASRDLKRVQRLIDSQKPQKGPTGANRLGR